MTNGFFAMQLDTIQTNTLQACNKVCYITVLTILSEQGGRKLVAGPVNHADAQALTTLFMRFAVVQTMHHLAPKFSKVVFFMAFTAVAK